MDQEVVCKIAKWRIRSAENYCYCLTEKVANGDIEGATENLRQIRLCLSSAIESLHKALLIDGPLKAHALGLLNAAQNLRSISEGSIIMAEFLRKKNQTCC
jgi:hypothetical protein